MINCFGIKEPVSLQLTNAKGEVILSLPISNKYKIGDKFRIKQLGKVETFGIETIIKSSITNGIGVIKSIHEYESGKSYELFIQDFTTLYVDDKYLDGLERIK